MKTKRTVKGALTAAIAKRKALDAYIKGLQALVKAGVGGIEAATLPNFAPKKKPGPKPGTRRTITKSANGVSATIKKSGAGKKAAGKNGKNGKPNLINAIIAVMAPTIGKKSTMNALEVKAELKRRHWLPSSDDPLGYIRYTLSSNKTIYLRDPDARGHYYLDSKPAAPVAKAKPGPKPKVKAPEASTAAPADPAPAPVAAAPAVAAPVPKAPKAATAPKVAAAPKATPAPAPAAPPPAPEEEDPSRVADDILASAGIDLTQDNPFAT